MRQQLNTNEQHGEGFPRLVQNAAAHATAFSRAFTLDAAWQAYQETLAIAETIDFIAGAVARVPPVVSARSSHFDVSPIVDVLAYPGLNRSRQLLVRELVTRMLVSGTGYFLLGGRHDRHPLSIDVVDSRFVERLPGPDGWPAAYRVGGPSGFVFKRVALTRSNIGYMSHAIGELVPVYEMPGPHNGTGQSRLTAIWSIVSAGERHGNGGELAHAVRRRFGVPSMLPGSDGPAAEASRTALHRDVVLPLFETVHSALARTLSERWNEDIRIEAATAGQG